MSLCVADCFEHVVSYAPPPYFSMDQPRSTTLLYRSGRAFPIATVTVDAKDTNSTKTVSRLAFRIKTAAGDSVVLLGNVKEVFYTYLPGVMNRMAAQFGAQTLATGIYDYTAVVKSVYTDATTSVTSVPVRVLVANSGSSPLGVGWELSEAQRIYSQADGGFVLTQGDGSVKYFAGPCATYPCSFQSPAGEFSTLRRRAATDSIRFERVYPNGIVIGFRADGTQAYAEDRFGNRTSYAVDASLRVTSITDPTGQAITLAYAGPNGTLSSITTPGSRATTVSIDASRRLTAIQDPAGGQPFQSAVYDTYGRLTGWSDRRGGGWNASYDCWWGIYSVTSPQVLVRGVNTRPVSYRRSPTRLVAKCSSSSDGTSANPKPATSADSARALVIDARGAATYVTLDPFWASTRVQEPMGRVTRNWRNAHSQIVAVRTASGDTLTNTWSGPDLTQTVDSATGVTVSMAYEPTYHELTSVVNGSSGTWNYWSAGKLDSADAGQQGDQYRTRYTYETIGGRITGRVATTKDRGGHVVTYAYLASGSKNLSTVTMASRTTTYSYDAYGRPTSVQQPDTRTSSTVYDVLNRVRKTINSSNDTTVTDYDSLYVVKERDGRGADYLYQPNALGWVTQVTDPSGGVRSFTFDSGGLVVSATNRRGQTVTFAYDALGNQTQRAAAGDTARFSIDPLGRFSAASNAISVDTVRFNIAGIPTTEISVQGGRRFERTSTFNQVRNRTQLQVALIGGWSASINYHYDAAQRLDTLTDFGGKKTTLSYDNDGLPSLTRLPTVPALETSSSIAAEHMLAETSYNDVAIAQKLGADSYLYAPDMMLDKKIRWSNPSEEVGRSYLYNSKNWITGYQDYQDIPSQYVCPYGPAGQQYDVDPETGEPCWTTPSYTVTKQSIYEYDRAGNRSDSGAVVLPGDRLVRFRGDTMVYDADGNMIKRWALAGGRSDSLEWNALGQLVSVTRNGVTTAFAYDALGRRVRKIAGGVTTWYLYDGANIVADLDGSGNRVADYSYYPGVDEIHSLRRWVGGVPKQYFVATDPSRNVTGLIDSTRTLAKWYEYEPFGTKSDSGGTVVSPIGFASRPLDAETDLYYVRARYYDPRLGRFISEDPAGRAAGSNPYLYASNNPLIARDPSGNTYEVTCPRGWKATVLMDEEGNIIKLHCEPPANGAGFGDMNSLLSSMGLNPFSGPGVSGVAWGLDGIGTPGSRGGPSVGQADLAAPTMPKALYLVMLQQLKDCANVKVSEPAFIGPRDGIVAFELTRQGEPKWKTFRWTRWVKTAYYKGKAYSSRFPEGLEVEGRAWCQVGVGLFSGE